ncbi:F-box/LRR-repeat protein 14 [Hondaea fermentalgiana]|uniref:F-box/LRR-repeat protein 14 n=1 Tax=Hondaea fermentalgiana TaxID=2315210 RepID=A0A2R5FZW9_9STRA|nr:F-box/LRR-repeat protein 14 [Hondaea fermentalgiana]|eukprot:GBG24316.1 F-box/LRR-repeat protein 14 [Hondaea fermentalgiana]
MGNRLSLSSLPLPSFVGGTVDCGPEPVLLPDTSTNFESDSDSGQFRQNAIDDEQEVDSFVYLQQHQHQLQHPRTPGRDRGATETAGGALAARFDEERGYGSPVAYASTFFLKGLESESYVFSADGKDAGQSPTVEASSLITFHSQGAEQINFRGDTDLINVEDDHIVTIYANIEAGKYLCPGPQSTRRMSWKSNVHLMDQQPPLCEWRVRRHGQGQHIDEQDTFVDEGQILLSSKVNERTLRFGDIVTLESVSRPGCFLVAKPGHVHLQLSSIEEGLFVIAPPQLKHLVRLSGNAQPPERLTRLDAPKKVSKEDAAWLRLLQRLPHDLVYRILQFKGRWVRTARLVSRDWSRAAEQHVFGIRVNGEYAGVATLEERRTLLNFVLRCKHLTSLTLRNLDDLLDEEVSEQIMECLFLRRLALGGCRRLSDAAFKRIGMLARITHLNVAATQVTDEFLELVFQGCKRLENLNLYGCKQVTLTGIERVLQLPSLLSINIRGTALDKATADRLQRAHLPKQVLVGAALADGVYG